MQHAHLGTRLAGDFAELGGLDVCIAGLVASRKRLWQQPSNPTAPRRFLSWGDLLGKACTASLSLRRARRIDANYPIAATSQTTDQGGVAYMAHAGGLVAGFTLTYHFRGRGRKAGQDGRGDPSRLQGSSFHPAKDGRAYPTLTQAEWLHTRCGCRVRTRKPPLTRRLLGGSVPLRAPNRSWGPVWHGNVPFLTKFLFVNPGPRLGS